MNLKNKVLIRESTAGQRATVTEQQREIGKQKNRECGRASRVRSVAMNETAADLAVAAMCEHPVEEHCLGNDEQ